MGNVLSNLQVALVEKGNSKILREGLLVIAQKFQQVRGLPALESLSMISCIRFGLHPNPKGICTQIIECKVSQRSSVTSDFICLALALPYSLCQLLTAYNQQIILAPTTGLQKHCGNKNSQGQVSLCVREKIYLVHASDFFADGTQLHDNMFERFEIPCVYHTLVMVVVDMRTSTRGVCSSAFPVEFAEHKILHTISLIAKCFMLHLTISK